MFCEYPIPPKPNQTQLYNSSRTREIIGLKKRHVTAYPLIYGSLRFYEWLGGRVGYVDSTPPPPPYLSFF